MGRARLIRLFEQGVESPGAQASLLILLGVLLWFVYRPGLSGPFVFDDFQNISLNPGVAIGSLSYDDLVAAAFSKIEGGLGRPLPMLTFALNYYFAGKSFDPFYFKFTNLVIHLINAALVFFLARAIFRLPAVPWAPKEADRGERRVVLAALFTAAVWALHPIQLTSVLYTVQRMNSMSALFVLAGMLVYLRGRRLFPLRAAYGLGLMAVGLAGGVGLGILCKENAVLLPLFAVIAELVFFTRGELDAKARLKLVIFYLVFFALPVFAGSLYVLMNPDFILASYGARSFGLQERVLTEFRVLFFYLSLIIVPLISRFGLYHDDFQLSTGLLAPPSTVMALLGWALLAAVLVLGLRRRSVWAFGLGWFLAGHVLESTVIGLEIIHEHRNYVPTIGLCVAAAYYFVSLFRKMRFDSRTVAVSALCLLLALGFVSHARAYSWSSRLLLFNSLVHNHPGSYRALAGLAATMREQGRDARAVYNTLRDAALANPDTVHPLIEMQIILYALLPLSERVEGGVSALLNSSAVRPSWAEDVVLNREKLLEIDLALEEEISKRLKSDGVHIETVYALWTAQACVIDGREECVPLIDRMLEWHLIAIEALSLRGNRRGVVELSAAKLYAARGELDQALEYVDRSIETMSGHPRYRAQKALLLVLLGEIDEAERIADEIENAMDWRRIYRGDVEALRVSIATARAGRPQSISSK